MEKKKYFAEGRKGGGGGSEGEQGT